MIRISSLFLVLLLVTGATTTEAHIAKVRGKIERILTDDTLYGGCMVFAPTIKPLDEYGLACRNNYFTFDCRNEAERNGGRAEAELNLQQAQLAMAINAEVELRVDDSITLNGNCYAGRVTVFTPHSSE
jgi:hypothetical protein